MGSHGSTAVDCTSLKCEGRIEADRHKWIESQKHGFDLGEQAIRDWYARFWQHFCRHKRFEHLEGRRQYLEFPPQEFGGLYQLLKVGDELLNTLLDRFKRGSENLDIIIWAHEVELPMDRVLYLLELININLARIDP